MLAGPTPIFAAEIAASSRIDGVIVYPGVASVTRIVEVEVPAGQHTIVVSGLPQALDPNSLRVEGVSLGQLSIGSVEMRTQPLGGVTGPSGEVAQRLKKLQEDRQRKQAELNALTAKQQMIGAIGQQAPAILTGKDRPLDPGEWAKAWDAVGAGLARTAEGDHDGAGGHPRHRRGDRRDQPAGRRGTPRRHHARGRHQRLRRRRARRRR